MEHGFSTTVDEGYAESLVAFRSKKVVDKQVREGVRLSTILEQYFDSITPEDPCFLSIDLEMHDLIALNSNDWKRFKPRVICVEDGDDPTNVRAQEISSLLKREGYR